MLYHDPAAKTHDRFGFTATMAVAMHVAVILGLGFALKPPAPPAVSTLDITLANYSSEKEIVDADFLAQTNQEASGQLSDKQELATQEIAIIDSATIKPINPVATSAADHQQASESLQISTLSASRAAPTEAQQQQQKQDAIEAEISQLKREIELASLRAKLAQEKQTFARLPSLSNNASVATKAAVDAAYLYEWQQRIEVIGNQHYPREAQAKGLYGNVEVLVVLHSDGKLKSVQVTKSSGVKVLDDAALRIVRLASPFKPFPPAMKQSMDELKIPRTWQFQQDRFQRQRS
ncbi:MAG: energy transducer TonB [Pseudomonadales bacterium]|nr:energy transducer TonB [Pseudomonadales bacterium]